MRRRAAAAAVAVLLLAGCGKDAPAPATTPEWKGPELSDARATVTEYVVRPVSPKDPEAIAKRVVGPTAVFRRVGTRLSAQRSGDNAATAPDEAETLAVARRFLTAYGMDPDEWSHRMLGVANGERTVLFVVTDEVPVFPFKGVQVPTATVRVDAQGVRNFVLVPARLTPRQVDIMSQREAFARVTEAGRYVRVRRVLADDGDGVLRPYWEFASDDRKLRPILAVLTP